jgi:hypothetical protein
MSTAHLYVHLSVGVRFLEIPYRTFGACGIIPVNPLIVGIWVADPFD